MLNLWAQHSTNCTFVNSLTPLTSDITPQEIRRLVLERNDSSKNVTKTIITKRYGCDWTLYTVSVCCRDAHPLLHVTVRNDTRR